jgi:uncharacterized Zn finger protein
MSGERPTSVPGVPGKWTESAAATRRNELPRKVRHGLKLQSKVPLTPAHPVAQRWLKLVESRTSPTEFVAAMEYARAGQTISMDVQPGVVGALVQGFLPRAHTPQIEFGTLSESQWSELINLMAGEALYVARLLASELPSAVDEMFAAVNAPLLQGESETVEFSCDCGSPQVCIHAAAVGILLADRIDSDPLLVFTLYGMRADQVLDRLRHARQTHDRASGAASEQSLVPQNQPLPPLESCLDEYWHRNPASSESSLSQTSQRHAPHALLRRLGPSPLQGKFPMVGLLASIYDSVTQAANLLRDDSGGDGAG